MPEERKDAPVPNLLTNPSFEAVRELKFGEGVRIFPEGWHAFRTVGEAELGLADEGHKGQRSVFIHSESGTESLWFVVANVRPCSVYRLSGWIRTEEVGAGTGVGAVLGAQQVPAAVVAPFLDVYTAPLTGDHDWRRVETEFNCGFNDSLVIVCALGFTGTASGKVWFDDICLEFVREGPITCGATIEADKAAEPISKYIYGQFVEHMGECVYGGIWAEMLQDRKFLRTPGQEDSPWTLLAGTALDMAPSRSFTGEHSPRLTGPGGVAQGGLLLQRDREYAGRVALAGAGPAEIALVWGSEADQRQTVEVSLNGGGFVACPFRFTAGVDTKDGRFEITTRQADGMLIGAASLMPADNVKGIRADTLAALKELNATVYRWPGGNFVSGYDWRDGIGDRDRRPPRWDRAWSRIEPNDFGLHEFLEFCRLVEAEPFIVVNSGLGDAESAAKELAYVNGPSDSPMGRLRAENGHPEPYGVKLWGIGNEMYGAWQLGHMPLDDYIKKHNRFAEAMRAVDPDIILIGVGLVSNGWSRRMMENCAGLMGILSEHLYVGNPMEPVAHMRSAGAYVRAICDHHRKLRYEIPGLAQKDVRLSIDEWNYWYGEHVHGPWGTRGYLKDAFGVAGALHAFARNSDLVTMACYSETVNVLGCIKTTPASVWTEASGLVLRLYRQRFGSIPVRITGEPGFLDIAAAWTSDRAALTLGVVNPSGKAVDLPLKLEGAKVKERGKLWRISGTDPMAYNTAETPSALRIAEEAANCRGDILSVPALSVSLFRFEVA